MQKSTDYRPNEAVLAALRNVALVAVVGPSGSGKTTLVNLATKQDSSLHVVVSDVSRKPRSEERDGVDYFFRDKADILAAMERREYVQVAPSNSGDIYATHIENYATDGRTTLLTVWADAVPGFRLLPFKSMRTLFVVPASYEAWQAHLGLHGFNPELHAKRLAEAERSLNFALQDPAIELIVNDDLTHATADFVAVIHRAADAPMPDQTVARKLVQQLLTELLRHRTEY
jgi:guanylate kinase